MLSRQIFIGAQEFPSPTIAAAGVVVTFFSVALLGAVALLRH